SADRATVWASPLPSESRLQPAARPTIAAANAARPARLDLTSPAFPRPPYGAASGYLHRHRATTCRRDCTLDAPRTGDAASSLKASKARPRDCGRAIARTIAERACDSLK